MSQSFDFDLWHNMLKESLWWKETSPEYAFHIYQNTVAAWGTGMHYYAQDGVGGAVDLTKLYEQCKLVSLLKKDHDEEEIPSTEC
jgi:hypothetical protein